MKLSNLLFLVFLFSLTDKLYAWGNEKTHPAITNMAVTSSGSQVDSYLKNELGLSAGLNTQLQYNFPDDIKKRIEHGAAEPYKTTRSILDWLRVGSVIEDTEENTAYIRVKAPWRPRHHFYDPTRNAGLDNHTAHPDWNLQPFSSWFPLGESSLDWAINGHSSYDPFDNYDKWTNARNLFYLSLIEPNKAMREAYLAESLMKLGCILHLLEDLGVPAHTRNDFLFAHYRTGTNHGEALENNVETKVETNGGNSLWSSTDTVAFDRLAKYFDTDTRDADHYLGNGVLPPTTWGLSEATNYQFMSLSTVFGSYLSKYYFPHPHMAYMGTPIEEGAIDKKIYFNGINYGVSHIARKSYTYYYTEIHNIYGQLSTEVKQKIDSTVTTDDEKVLDDYANITIPRTIDYAAGLANYFFRGRLKVEPNWTDPNFPKFVVTNDSNNSGIAQTLKGGGFEIYWDDKDGNRTQIIDLTIVGGWNSSSTLAYDSNITITFPKLTSAQPVKYAAIYKGNICQNPDAPDPCDVNAIAVCVLSPGFEIVAWGRNDFNQISDVPAGSDFIALAAGRRHGLALKSDGSIHAWGSNQYGQCDVPADGNVVYTAIAGGSRHSIALKSDGSIVVWGDNSQNQITNKPTGNDFIAIAAGEFHSLALKSDGSIIGWGGYNNYNECDAPPPDTGTVYTQISAGRYHSMALQSDGIPKAWGSNNQGQTRFYDSISGIAQVAACDYYSMVLRNNGWITTWGNSDWFTPDVLPRYHHRPADGNDFVAVAAGWDHILALTSDGKVFAYNWPMGDYPFEHFRRTVPEDIVFAVGQTDSPQTSISAGYDFSLALKAQ